MSKPVFVIVTADTCSHCRYFKSAHLTKLKDKIQRDNSVDLVEISLPTTSTTTLDTTVYPIDIKRWIQWFPTFLLFTAESWKSRGKLVGFVFNGQFTRSGKLEYIKEFESTDDESVYQWILTKSKDPIFANPHNSSSIHIGSKIKYHYEFKRM
jgi:thioredoxin-related protein